MKRLMIAALGATVMLAAACGGGSTAPKEEAAVSTPTFTEEYIVGLTQEQLRLGTVIPTGAKTVVCLDAYFRPDADVWVVDCNLYLQGGTQTRSYTVSDKDGKLVK